jgi:hypothetical protein
MIEKLDKHLGIIKAGNITYDSLKPASAKEMHDKINELVDAVNAIQKEREAEWFEIQEWIGILEAVRKSVNVHEKQIDELQMKTEPEKCEIRSENVQPVAETRSENVQDKLERTRKALDVAKDTFNWIDETYRTGQEMEAEIWGKVQLAAQEITALEQKD